MTAPTPDAADEREALVEVAVAAMIQHQRIPTFDRTNVGGQRCDGCDHLLGEPDGPNSPRHVEHQARAVLDAVADRLVALGDPCPHRDEEHVRLSTAEKHRAKAEQLEERLAEVEAERDEAQQHLAGREQWAERARAAIKELAAERDAARLRAERAEADLAAAEQRAVDEALGEVQRRLYAAGYISTTAPSPRSVVDRYRADRLGTQAEGEA